MKIRRPAILSAVCFRRGFNLIARAAFFYRSAKRQPIVDPVEWEYTQITKPEAIKRLTTLNKPDR